MIFMNNFYKLLKRDHVQFNLFNSIINVAAVDWFLFASNPTGRCFSHSFDLLSVQHGTYILQMLHLHSEFASKYFKIFQKKFSTFSQNISKYFLSVQHGTYILHMLLRIYTQSSHENIFLFSSMKKNIA